MAGKVLLRSAQLLLQISFRQLQKGAQPAFIRFTLLFQFSEMFGSADCRQDGYYDDDRSGAPNSIASRESPSLKETNLLKGISPASQVGKSLAKIVHSDANP
jgi:hypothetical protein